MLLFNRLLLLCLMLSLSACAFSPVYQANSPARAMLGKIDIEVKSGRFDFAFRTRLQARLGQADTNAPYLLRYNMTVKSSDLVISETADITRFVLNGTVSYHIFARDTQTSIYSNTVRATTAYSATAGTYPTEVARKDANIRLSYSMAERIADQMALSAQGWLK